MTRRFAPEELTFLRNRVPIDRVIEILPDLAGRNKNGQPSFVCPLCGALTTSINAAHNLARCFSCRRNFNPIELVMHHLKIGFVDSVKWLQKNIAVSPSPSRGRHAGANKTQPIAIADILSNVMPAATEIKTESNCSASVLQRISRLESSLSHLYRLVNQLQSSLDR